MQIDDFEQVFSSAQAGMTVQTKQSGMITMLQLITPHASILASNCAPCQLQTMHIYRQLTTKKPKQKKQWLFLLLKKHAQNIIQHTIKPLVGTLQPAMVSIKQHISIET